MNRRSFIKSVGALAALAAVPQPVGAALRALTPDEAARFLAMARTGIIADQVFRIARPVTIDFGPLIVTRCLFYIELPDTQSAFNITKHAVDLGFAFVSNHFICNAHESRNRNEVALDWVIRLPSKKVASEVAIY